MKRIFITAVLAVLCSVTFAQTSVFEKYKNINGVSTVYIGKAMLSMMNGANVGGHNLGKLGSRIDRMCILDCEKKSLFAAVKAQVAADMRRNKYDMVMTANDGGENVVIYHKVLPGKKNDFLLLATSEDNVSVINISGAISMQDIQKFSR